MQQHGRVGQHTAGTTPLPIVPGCGCRCFVCLLPCLYMLLLMFAGEYGPVWLEYTFVNDEVGMLHCSIPGSLR